MSTVSVIVDRRWLNSVVTGFGTVAVAIPNFVTGTILVVLFGVVWAVLPAGGVPRSGFLDDPGISVQYLILPPCAWLCRSQQRSPGSSPNRCAANSPNRTSPRPARSGSHAGASC